MNQESRVKKAEKKTEAGLEDRLVLEEERRIQDSFEQEKEYQPKIVKIAASERLLPKNFIPDERKDSEYEKQTGRALSVVLFNFAAEERIVLPDVAAQVFKHSIRKTRERYANFEERRKRYDAIQRIILAQVVKGLPTEKQLYFESRMWEARALTTVTEYERLKTTVFRNVEEELKETANEQKEIAVSAAEEQKVQEGIESLYVNWAAVIPSADEMEKVLAVNPAKVKEKILPVETREREPSELTELQKARLMFGRKKISGGEFTKEEVERHIAIQDRMPDYLAHRLAIYDIYFRVKSGEIEGMPRLILSVASGPYGEARAQSDLIHLYEELGAEKPVIVNLDLTHEMLRRGREEYEKKYAEKLLKVVPLTGRMEAPMVFKPEVFDMSECTSSLDYLQEPADVFKTVSAMTEATKIGGLVRLTSRRKFPGNFYEGMEGLGLKILTERQSTFQMPEKMAASLKALYGQEKAAQLKGMLESGIHYILAQRAGREKDISKITIDNFKLPAEAREKREREEKFATLLRLVNERLGMIEKAVKDGNMPEAKNLFWEFGKQGREMEVNEGTRSSGDVEAFSLSELVKRSGALVYKKWYKELAEKVFGA